LGKGRNKDQKSFGVCMAKNKKLDWTTKDWAKKLKQQAKDSEKYRHKLYEKVDLKNKKHILDVGCGTGVITKDIALETTGKVVGVDIDPKKLELAKKHLAKVPNITLKEANALDLPYKDKTFDLVIFTLVLIHVKSQQQQKAVNEMARVIKQGGIVLACLEPDYASIIEYPENPLTPLSLESLSEIGADLMTGRKLKFLFANAGLKTEMGMDTESEFLVIKDDKKRLKTFLENFWVYEKIFQKNKWSKSKIEKYKQKQIELIKNGLSFSFPPAFYAIGKKI
jgi:ubiquinone/menaquinone biosynthesis C-methylase UbiE